MFERRSALAERVAVGGRDGADGRRGIVMTEMRGGHVAQLTVFRDAPRGDPLRESVLPLLGELPTEVGSALEGPRTTVLRLGFDLYWVATREASLIDQLARAVPAGVGCVTPLTSRVRLTVEGPEVYSLLCKGIALDLHPRRFVVGRVAQTELHHSGVVLLRAGESRFDLYILRSFAASIWDWLIDAALPIGYDVAVVDWSG